MRISIFGLGQVGQVLCACFAEQGHSVVGVDVDPAKIEDLSSGRTQISEPKLAEMLKRHAASGLITAMSESTTAIRSTEISFVCVGTPSAEDGRVDTTHLSILFKSLRPAFDAKPTGHALVLRSTCPWIVLEQLLEETLPGVNKGESTVGLAVQPEFLREGSAVADFFNPSRTLIGTTNPAVAEQLTEIYRDLPAKVYVTSPAAALMVKYADNAFHALKVAFANEIGRLCQASEINAMEVMRLFCSDTKLNCSPAYLRPGGPIGGSCLPKDLRAINHLARSADLNVPVLASVLASNDAHFAHILRLVKETGHRDVGLFGLSFKPDTNDLRESPAIRLMRELVAAGFSVFTYDPQFGPELSPRQRAAADVQAPELRGRWCVSQDELLDRCQLLIVTSAGMDWGAMVAQPRSGQIILDLDGGGREPMAGNARYRGVCW